MLSLVKNGVRMLKRDMQPIYRTLILQSEPTEG